MAETALDGQAIESSGVVGALLEQEQEELSDMGMAAAGPCAVVAPAKPMDTISAHAYEMCAALWPGTGPGL